MPHQCTNCEATFPDGSKEMLSGCPHCGGNTFQYIPEGADPESTATDHPPEPPPAEDSVAGRVGRAASTVKEFVSERGETAESASTDTVEPVSDDGTVTEKSSDPSVSTDADPDIEDPPSDAEPDAGTTEFEPDDGEVVPSGASTDAETPEDSAQASARGEVADLSDLPASSGSDGASSTDEPTADPGGVDDQPPGDRRDVGETDSAADTDLETLREELNDQFESIRIVEPGQYELNLMELYDREEHIVALREDGKYVIEVPETWRDGE